MKIEAIVREVSRDDKSLYADGPDGAPMFIGHPLRDYLARMTEDGYVDLPFHPVVRSRPPEEGVATAHPGLSLANDRVDPDVTLDVVDAETVRVSLQKWRGRDPDNTFRMIGFQFSPTDAAERAAVLRAFESNECQRCGR